jgi:hypothetical protein
MKDIGFSSVLMNLLYMIQVVNSQNLNFFYAA